jgi:hypothetical protein
MCAYTFEFDYQFSTLVLSCSLRSHHKTNPTQKMATPLFALPAHHPENDSQIAIKIMKNGIQKYTVEKKSKGARDATAANERFGAMAALPRRQFCANLNVIPPQQVQWKPPLRQAAGTLWRNPLRSLRHNGSHGKTVRAVSSNPGEPTG